jgi:hypothetical protein
MEGLFAFMTIKGIQTEKYDYRDRNVEVPGTKQTILAVVKYTKWYAAVRHTIFATTCVSLVIMACRRSMITGDLELQAVFGPTTEQPRWSCAPSWASESLRVLYEDLDKGVSESEGIKLFGRVSENDS